MALVDYSGSESSDEEQKPVIKEVTKPKTSSKPAFQKVVDSSEPHKIRVSLSESSKSGADQDDSQRPSKRAKLGAGGWSGFNALLPAPKRATSSSTGLSSNGMQKGGLGAGVNLRTGAAPGFSREPEPSTNGAESVDETAAELDKHGPDHSQINLRRLAEKAEASPISGPTEEMKPKGKSTIFKPLSVGRKPQKKKKAPLLNNPSDTKVETFEASEPPTTAPKASLFSVQSADHVRDNVGVSKGPYVPMVYQASDTDHSLAESEVNQPLDSEEPSATTLKPIPTFKRPDSLDTIASDLNLSKSAKRQLLGRQKNSPSAVNIVNFNTDAEYKANEEARQSGEQVQHNAVRAIAPGRHSLKQLVNMGTMQADALEESFASGRRNRSEAGSKYGW